MLQSTASTSLLHQIAERDHTEPDVFSYRSMDFANVMRAEVSRPESCDHYRIPVDTPCQCEAVHPPVVTRSGKDVESLHPAGSFDPAGYLLHSLISSLQSTLGRASQQHHSSGGRRRVDESDTHYPPGDVEATDLVRHQFDNAKCRTTPTWVTGWNVLNLIQGIGILGIPYAFAHGGWVSIPATLLLAITCCFTGCLLGDCLYEYPRQNCEKPSTSNPEMRNRVRVRSTNACIAADVFPCGGRGFANVIVMLELFGACVVYMILLGQSMAGLFSPLCDLSTTSWTVIMVYLCLPILLWPQMKLVAWFGVIALVGLFGSILVIFIYSGLELAHVPPTAWQLPPPAWNHLPVSLSIVIFSYCAHSALPGIEGLMAHPEKYNLTLKCAFSMAGLTTVLFGSFTTLVFQEETAQAVTDSMTVWPKLCIVARVQLLLNGIFSLPLVFYLLGEQLDCSILNFVNDSFFTSNSCLSVGKIWFLSSRCVLINLGLICGTMVPQFALIMGLVGAVSGSLLCFILPAFFHLRLFWYRLSIFAKGLRVVIIIFGMAVGVFGTVASIMELRAAF